MAKQLGEFEFELQGKTIKSIDYDCILFDDGSQLLIYGNDLSYELQPDPDDLEQD
jgi:hypothetical protein